MLNYGFIKPESILPEEHVLGDSTLAFPTILPNGDWKASLPVKELQRMKFETFNCTGFKTLDQIETYIFEVFGEKVNYSDRWVGIIAGTKEPGNDPQKIYEAIREYGLIPEEMLPYSDDLNSIDEYYSFKGADKDTCYAEGKKWKEKYEFFHKWVFLPNQPLDEKINNMKVALTKSPLTGDVYAWEMDGRGVYVRWGESNHWTTFRAYDEFERCFDSYEPVEKDVDQELYYCKCIYIRKRPEVQFVSPQIIKTSLWQKILNFFLREISLLKYFNERPQ
jgi:hypothetical protein